MGVTNVSNPDDARADLDTLFEKEEQEQEKREDLEQTRRRIERADSRGVGKMHLTVNYPRDGVDEEKVPFVRLPMSEATDVLEGLEDMQGDDDVSTKEIAEHLANTLDEYSLDPEKDAKHWSDELTIGDAMGLVRNVAFGGSPPGK